MTTQAASDTAAAVNRGELEAKVKEVYRAVALHPEGRYHFRMGRELARELGYPDELLDKVPAGALESFAGVGYFFGLAALAPGKPCWTWAPARGPTSSPQLRLWARAEKWWAWT
ncbi:hypothetical protein [Arthrobacter sp. SD76]|uniref:hypothetical protein n=1 Tax=Arthrobacter sp. SD76 TaxID=3415007 RepID=UPI003C717162